MTATDPYLVASWSDEDLNPVREFRRVNALMTQDPLASKEEKRDAKKCVKAATIVLQVIEGTGPCISGIPRNFFPAELDIHLMRATARLGIHAW